MKRKPLVISLLISLGTGAVAGFFTSQAMTVYQEMSRPPLSPPGWIFPIVWTVLYILMGIAAWLIYLKRPKAEALKLYLIQLAVNFLWPFLFFNLHWYILSAIWLFLLWYLVFLLIREFSKIDKTAGWLLLPYLVWLTFAAYLNLAIVFCR